MAIYERLDPNHPRGQLRGSVSCASTGLPLAGATILAQSFGPEGYQFNQGLYKLGESDPDGTFKFSSIVGGSYYLLACLSGYATPAYLLQTISLVGIPWSFSAGDAVPTTVLHRVRITPEKESVCNFFLHKAASLSGRVTWQDGTPARGNRVTLMLVDGKERRRYEHPLNKDFMRSHEPIAAITDEDGHFRIPDLFTGKYIVGRHVPRELSYVRQVTYPGQAPKALTFRSSFYWSGQKHDYREALPIEVTCGTHLAGLDTELPILEQKPLQILQQPDERN